MRTTDTNSKTGDGGWVLSAALRLISWSHRVVRRRGGRRSGAGDSIGNVLKKVHRRALVRRIGLLTSRGWAQHIVDRWHDAVSNRPTASHTTEIDLAADEFLSDNPHRGGYHGMHVPGA